jgi:hypothetical protein
VGTLFDRKPSEAWALKAWVQMLTNMAWYFSKQEIYRVAGEVVGMPLAYIIQHAMDGPSRLVLIIQKPLHVAINLHLCSKTCSETQRNKGLAIRQHGSRSFLPTGAQLHTRHDFGAVPYHDGCHFPRQSYTKQTTENHRGQQAVAFR